MNLDAFFARIDGSALFQPFYERTRELIESLAADGHQYYATCGVRTFEEQDALYAKGRQGVPGEGKVTNARSGSSAHNFRCAIDFCADADVEKAGLQPVWKTEAYRPLAEKAVTMGLEAGFNWSSLSDAPHIQLPLMSKGITMAKLKEIHLTQGEDAVLAFLGTFTW